MRWSVKVALVAATISLSHESLAATITVHEPDASGRVFVDVVGELNIGDEKAFEQKTANRRNVIVTLISPGGNPLPAMEMGKSIRKHAMATFVPGNRMCASACALIWLAGKPRTLESNARVGFHAAYNRSTGRESCGQCSRRCVSERTRLKRQSDLCHDLRRPHGDGVADRRSCESLGSHDGDNAAAADDPRSRTTGATGDPTRAAIAGLAFIPDVAAGSSTNQGGGRHDPWNGSAAEP